MATQALALTIWPTRRVRVVEDTANAIVWDRLRSRFLLIVPTAVVVANPQKFLQPGYICAGAASFTLTVVGTGFTGGSTATVGGIARALTFISATQVTLAVLAADVLVVGLPEVKIDGVSIGYLVVQQCGVPAAGKGPMVRPVFDHLANVRPDDTGDTLRSLAGIHYLAGRSERW